MLMGLCLLALGLALLCYVALARPAIRAKAPALQAPANQSSPPNAPPSELEPELYFVEPSEPPPESLAPPESRVVVCYEDEAEDEEATSPNARILVSAQGDSDRGHKRRANDDTLLLLPQHSLFAVADGMGGYAGGKVASSLAVETLMRAFEGSEFTGALQATTIVPRRGRELASAILQSHQAVFSAARASRDHSKMGTTLVAARFSPNKQRVYIGHVGDSRCYRWRGGSLRQLTRDQTMGSVGLRGPRAGDLLQAIGVTAGLTIDLIVDKPHAGDIYLLCSDGLTKMASDGEIEAILAGERDLEAAVYELIELANDSGGRDNVTVVLVQVAPRAHGLSLEVPSASRDFVGWSKLPSEGVITNCSSDDVTVVGALPADDPTTISAAPLEKQR